MSTGVRFDWGLAGARAAATESPAGGALVIVDVLSFSTAVAITTGRGTAVYPHPWPSPDVPAFAAEHDAVWAAGERWPGGELRPALEDLLGAAAIIAAFGPQHARSPEASATEAAWHAHHHRAAEFLLDCYSGQELTGRGFTADVTLAAGHDAQTTVPVLTNGAFRPVA